LLLSFLIHAFIEIKYLSWAEEQGRAVSFYGGCALAPWLQIALWLFGALGGYFLGRWWWRIVYIDRAWEKKIK
jgi:MFS family permease